MPDSFTDRPDLPRGIRNNNPGNIKTGEAWQGMTGDDGTFIIFKDITWGTRALATDLANKIREGHNTIRSIIYIYAPPLENDTDKYVAAVSRNTGLDPDMPLSMDQVTLHNLSRAIINHENGDQASALVTDADIDQGIGMMNDSLITLFQAAGVAVETAVEKVTSNSAGSGGLLTLGLIALAAILLFSGAKNKNHV